LAFADSVFSDLTALLQAAIASEVMAEAPRGDDGSELGALEPLVVELALPQPARRTPQTSVAMSHVDLHRIIGSPLVGYLTRDALVALRSRNATGIHSRRLVRIEFTRLCLRVVLAELCQWARPGPRRAWATVFAMPVTLERRALAVVGEVIGLLDLDELCHGMIRALRQAVPAEWCSLNELPADLPHTVSLAYPEIPAELHVAFAEYALQNPLVDYYLRTKVGRAVRFSDLITRRELHRLDLYREVYEPLGVEYQIAFTLPSASQRVLGIALSRAKRDFTATERDLLNLLRPYMIQAYRNALAYTELARGAGRQIVLADLRPLGLTDRQAEVLRLVAMGRSDKAAADTLGIGIRTVQKHLEHCYRILEVSDRSRAAQLAWETASN
jgi:DNA-binding CsgD family transcriptional regulator